MRPLSRTLLMLVVLCGCATQGTMALTIVHDEELNEGVMFDATSARSQKMLSVLCYGRDRSFCAKQKEPPRYYGMGFMCDWPQLFSENMTPDDQPNTKRFTLPSTGLQVGPMTQGQLCYFRVNAFILRNDEKVVYRSVKP